MGRRILPCHGEDPQKRPVQKNKDIAAILLKNAMKMTWALILVFILPASVVSAKNLEGPIAKATAPSSVKQGEAFAVLYELKSQENEPVRLGFRDKEVPCYSDGKEGICLAAVPADAKTRSEK